VLTDVTTEMVITKEETFSPVAPLYRFKTDDEAVEMANDTHPNPPPHAEEGREGARRRAPIGDAGSLPIAGVLLRNKPGDPFFIDNTSHPANRHGRNFRCSQRHGWHIVRTRRPMRQTIIGPR
jgi:hypothetical protein